MASVTASVSCPVEPAGRWA